MIVPSSVGGILRRVQRPRCVLRQQRRAFLPILLGGAATLCAVGFIGIAGIVVGDNLYRNWQDRQAHKDIDQRRVRVEVNQDTSSPQAGRAPGPPSSALNNGRNDAE